MFSGKKILVGITGGIAAYKTCEIIRELVKNNGTVRVMMTPNATQFVTPLTFETLTGYPVYYDMFATGHKSKIEHIQLARWPEAILICPATANTIGKLAAGLSDNALTTVLAATTAAVIICPAMNKEMYGNKIFQRNMEKLSNLGYLFVAPGHGDLACGEVGWGRLADSGDIIAALEMNFFKCNTLAGLKILVTAGPTQEPIDPVRYLTNPSTGKMGYAIAKSALLRGAKVTLISGPASIRAFPGIDLVQVRTAAEMAAAVKQKFRAANVLIMTAAVADYRPSQYSEQKIKKSSSLFLQLEQTQDILADVSIDKRDRTLIGFAVETENELENAKKKLEKKNLDLIVVNNPLLDGAGFAGDTNIVTFVEKGGWSEPLSQLSKSQVAEKILDWLEQHLTKKVNDRNQT